MIRTKYIAQAAGAAMAVGAVWVAVGVNSAHASQPQIRSGVGPERPMPPMIPGGGGMFTSASAAVDENFLYVVRGSEVLKLRKGDLSVVGRVDLPPIPVSDFRRGGVQLNPPPAGGFGGGGGNPPPKQNL